MTPRRVLSVALVLCVVVGWLAPPVRWEVEGLSMAPGLMPGDVVQSGPFPLLDRLRRPRRFERWTLAAPDGALAVKRVWGLPGEEIGIVDGDVTVDGRVVVKPPWVLAEMALPVAPASRSASDSEVRIELQNPVFDDVPFAPYEQRVLAPVSDVGVSAIVHVDRDDRGDVPASLEIAVASRVISVQIRRTGRHAVVAGRLDGAFVAAAWPLEQRSGTRSCLPPGGPDGWAVQSRWNPDESVTSLVIRRDALAPHPTRLRITEVVAWRDIQQLVPATGTTRWQLDDDTFLVLGDYPGGSRDARQWGPVGVDRFRDRLMAPRR